MTTSTVVSIHPLRDASAPTVSLGGTDHDIPSIEIRDEWPGTDVRIQLGNHDDPAAWLRTFANRLLDLAVEVEAAKVEVTA